MAGYDYRANPREVGKLSYYIFDNLRCNQDREGGNVHRFDTVQEAVAVFKYISAEHPTWTTALGGSIFGTSEVDFIQRRMGANALVTDYKNMDYWKDSSDAKQAIDAAARSLNVEWQLDNSITENSIMVPYEPIEVPLDRYLERMELRPTDPGDALTSINEAYVEEHGWCSLQELRSLASSFGYDNPECPRVSRLNVAFSEPTPGENDRVGYVDVSPADFKRMRAAYELGREEACGIKTLEGWHQFAEETGNHSMEAYFKQGDVVGKDVIDHFTNIMPPVTHYSDLLQVGERYDDRMGDDGRYHARFTTFSKEGDQWLYRGHCFRGERTEPLNPEKSVRDLAKEARARVAEKNLARPEKPKTPKSQDLSW